MAAAQPRMRILDRMQALAYPQFDLSKHISESERSAYRQQRADYPRAVFSERDTHFRICYTVPSEKLKKGVGMPRRISTDCT
jgi:hypothetical protein